MQYKGDDLDLRVPHNRPVRDTYASPEYENGNGRRTRTAAYAPATADPLWVDETVLACCNYAYEIAAANGSGDVGLEHLVNALTRVEAASRVLEARGVREGQLRRESATLIANDIPAHGGSERTQPRRSAELEDALRRASDQANRRGAPATVDDLLWVLLHFGRDVPAVVLLRRMTPDWQRLEGDWHRIDGPRARDVLREPMQPEPRIVVQQPMPPPQILVAPQPVVAFDAIASRMGLIEDSLRSLHVELSAERKQLTELLRDTQRDVVAQRGDAASLRSDLAQRLETVERSLQAGPQATRLTVQLADRIQTLEKAVHGGLGEGARNWAALGQRLTGLEEAITESRTAFTAVDSGHGTSKDLIERIGALEHAIETRLAQLLDNRLNQSQRLVTGLADRMQAMERLVEAGTGEGGRHWTALSERLGSMETTLRSRPQAAAPEMGEFTERLSGLERAIRAGFGDSARTIGLVTERVEQIERNTQARPKADDTDAILILDDRMQSIERMMQDQIAAEASPLQLDAASIVQPLGQRLAAIERQTDERTTALGNLVRETTARIAALDQRLEQSQTALEQRLLENAASVEKQLLAASATGTVSPQREREVQEMYEAIVRLSENQTTLASAIADWRHDCNNDFSSLNIQLEKLQQPPAVATPVAAPVQHASAAAVPEMQGERTERYVDALGRPIAPQPGSPYLREVPLRETATPVVPGARRGFWWWLFGTQNITQANRDARVHWQKMHQSLKDARDRARERA